MLQTIDINETTQLPRVVLNAEKGYALFQGNSFASNAYEFYVPIFNWLETYTQLPKPTTILEFKLEYINSSSSKSISKILSIIKTLLDNSDVKVKWYYKIDDDDIKEMGEEYAHFLGLTFDYCEY
ncbi:MAG: DUF1987 family protein, partial [Bacteroidia bacterium]|nr:DUF1987 family protein [Bacteroidia bacterium]